MLWVFYVTDHLCSPDNGYTIFACVICAIFFSILTAEKSECIKYADFFFCGGLDLGFILVVPWNLSLLICTALYDCYSSFPSWNFNTSAHSNCWKGTEIFMVHSCTVLFTMTQRGTTPYFQGQASVLKNGI